MFRERTVVEEMEVSDDCKRLTDVGMSGTQNAEGEREFPFEALKVSFQQYFKISTKVIIRFV